MAMRLPPFQSAQSLACFVLIWLALGTVIQFSHLQILRVLARRPPGTADATAIFPDPWVLKHLSLGYDQLLADLWWLAFIQYYGDNNARKQDHYKLAYNYLDIITRLDPKFTQPYWFSAFAIGSDFGRPDLAQDLIDRGVRANQNDWYLPFIAGVNQFLFAHNEVAAARYYRMAAKFPNAPPWLGSQAKVLEAHGPTLLKEINTWANIYLSTKDTLVKEQAASKLRELWLFVYHNVPSPGAKKRAVEQLRALGVEVAGETQR
jgi:hypothetical protein